LILNYGRYNIELPDRAREVLRMILELERKTLPPLAADTTTERAAQSSDEGESVGESSTTDHSSIEQAIIETDSLLRDISEDTSKILNGVDQILCLLSSGSLSLKTGRGGSGNNHGKRHDSRGNRLRPTKRRKNEWVVGALPSATPETTDLSENGGDSSESSGTNSSSSSLSGGIFSQTSPGFQDSAGSEPYTPGEDGGDNEAIATPQSMASRQPKSVEISQQAAPISESSLPGNGHTPVQTIGTSAEEGESPVQSPQEHVNHIQLPEPPVEEPEDIPADEPHEEAEHLPEEGVRNMVPLTLTLIVESNTLNRLQQRYGQEVFYEGRSRILMFNSTNRPSRELWREFLDYCTTNNLLGGQMFVRRRSYRFPE